jgi:dTDP-6-deoxy-L-talose 4-dehydrogenase (NAD+)
MKIKKILITGATGFIGNKIITYLLKNMDFKIIATCKDLEKAKKMEWVNNVDLKIFDLNSDFNKFENLYEFFNKPDLMIHLAWEGLPNYKEKFHFEKNLMVHYGFLKNMVENGLKEITVSGTCFEYGMIRGCVKEDFVTNPNTAYGLAKDTLRKFLCELQKTNNFNLRWMRIFYLYSNFENYRSIFSQIDQAIKNGDEIFNMSGGEQVRDYLSVEELVENIIKISLQNKVLGSINCCSGKPVKLKQMIEDYLKNKNANISLNLGYYPYLDYEPFEFFGNVEKLNKAITAYNEKF